MTKYDLPEWVSKYKEKGKSIKMKNGNYYLYETKCIYDKTKKNKHYTKDTYLGRITEEDGFIPAKKQNDVAPENLFSKTYGHYCLFHKLSEDIYQRLEKYFGEEYAKYIYTIASLRAIENTPYAQLEDAYDESFFSVAYKNLSMSKSFLSNFLQDLSKYKTNMNSFMKEDVEKEDILVFDGTNILCSGNDISYRGYGYKHGHSYSSQLNELYAYSAKTKKPTFYKLLEGSVSDKSALKDFLDESGIQNCISLIDKGFNSESNLTSLLKNFNQYIIALRYDSKLVPEEVLKDTLRQNAKEMFTIDGEAVFGYEVTVENERICIYFNSTIASIMDSEYIDKMNQNKKGYEKENYAKKKERFGIYILKTNITEFSLEKIYCYYKSRFEIEYMFDTLKNTLGFDKTYMHSDKAIESWAFINHISLLLTQRVYDLLKQKDIKVSLHQLYKKLRQVKMIRNNLDKEDIYQLQGIPKKTRELLNALGIIS